MLKALGSGLVGACALTLIHETARRFVDDAPRMDVLGMRALAKTMRAVDVEPPVPLHEAALVGDIVSNSLYYSLVGAGPARDALRNGALLGLAAGLGAVVLPERLGLGRQPTEDSPQTQLMTVAWYTLGGLAAGAAYAALADEE
jgi:hypothetical protein